MRERVHNGASLCLEAADVMLMSEPQKPKYIP